MGATRRSRTLISMLVRSDADGNPVRVAGGSGLVAAFNDRDVDALKAVLHQHPQAWKTEMPWRANRAIDRQDCMAVKMAVIKNWARGLDVLLYAGADPNARHDPNDLTALDMAVRMARPVLVKRLLAAGARFRDNNPSFTIQAMFDKEYSLRWLDRSWRVMQALEAHGMGPWTTVAKRARPHAGVFLGMLDCYSHPDKGLGQATRLLEKFPVPGEHRDRVAKDLAKNLAAAGALWAGSSYDTDMAPTGALFEALSDQGLLPDHEAFVCAAARQWDTDAPPKITTRINSVLSLRLQDCDPARARALIDRFGGHPCLEGAPSALLSSLALGHTQNPIRPGARAARF